MVNEKQAWSEYWQAGKASTFGALDDASRNSGLVELWKSYLGEKLSGEILEVGCGNGALTKLLGSVMVDLEVIGHIHAVDIAIVAPTELEGSTVTTYSNTNAESLPFSDGSIDLIVSQFGYEYLDTEKAAIEFARVLRPGGALCCVAHHRSSIICRESFDTLRELIRIEESAIVVAAEALVNQLGILYLAQRDPRKDEKSEMYRKILNATAQELRTAATQSSVADQFTLLFLDSLFKVFKAEARDGLSQKDYISALSDSLYSYKVRLESQKQAAADNEGWEQQKEQLTKAGFEVMRLEPSVLNGYHFGTFLEARRC